MLSLFCYGCLVGDLLSLLGSDFDCSSVYLDSLYCFFGCCLFACCLFVVSICEYSLSLHRLTPRFLTFI